MVIAAVRGQSWIEKHPLTARSLLLIVIFGLNIVGFIRWNLNRSPEVPLDLAIKAIRAHDSTAFSDAVDIDRLVGSYYDQHLRHGKPVPEATRALYIKNIGRRLRHWIDSGDTENSYPRFDALVKFLGDSVESRRVQAGGVDERTSSETVTFQNQANDKVTMRLKVVKDAGRWRVAELLNANEVVSQVRNSELNRVAPLIRRMNEVAAITPFASSLVENNDVVTYVETVLVKRGRLDWASCDLVDAEGTFVQTIAAVRTPLNKGQRANFSFRWHNCAEADCLPRIRWAQVSVDGQSSIVRPLLLD
jgi:hypothetical protein